MLFALLLLKVPTSIQVFCYFFFAYFVKDISMHRSQKNTTTMILQRKPFIIVSHIYTSASFVALALSRLCTSAKLELFKCACPATDLLSTNKLNPCCLEASCCVSVVCIKVRICAQNICPAQESSPDPSLAQGNRILYSLRGASQRVLYTLRGTYVLTPHWYYMEECTTNPDEEKNSARLLWCLQ